MKKDNKNKKGFTLAETLIVLTVLGVILAIVAPQIKIRYQESMDRLKIKKSMTVYDMAIAKIVVENDLKTENALKSWAEEGGNCDNAVEYFKTSERNSCTFKTSDDTWWDITDIMQPIVAVSKKDLENAKINGTDGENSFKFTTSYDSMLGTFRVNDLIFEKKRLERELAKDEEDKQAEVQEKVNELEKLFGMVNGLKSASNSCSNDDILCKYNSGETLPACEDEKKSCIIYEDMKDLSCDPVCNAYFIYDSHGNNIVQYAMNTDMSNGSGQFSNSNNGEYKAFEKVLNSDGTYTVSYWCVNDNKNVYKCEEYTRDVNEPGTLTYY